MTTFAATFRAIVVPGLKRQIEQHALMVACEITEFDELYHDVMAQAYARGAWRLPDHILADLNQWVCSAILREMQRYTPAVANAKRRGEVPWAYVIQTMHGLPPVIDVPACQQTT
jgi:hypothetical protein